MIIWRAGFIVDWFMMSCVLGYLPGYRIVMYRIIDQRRKHDAGSLSVLACIVLWCSAWHDLLVVGKYACWWLVVMLWVCYVLAFMGGLDGVMHVA